MTEAIPQADATPPPVESGFAPHLRAYALPAVLLAAILAALPGLLLELHADDWFQVQKRSVGQVLATFAGDWNRGEQGVGGFYRPLVRVSFAVDNMLFGMKPVGYHATNGLLFMLLCWGAFRLAELLSRGDSVVAAGAVITLLVLNPMKNEALYWVSGRTDLLAACLVTWATVHALTGLRDGSAGRALCALLLLLLGLLAKEVAVAGSAILLLSAILFMDATSKRAGRIVVVGTVAVTLAYATLRTLVLGGVGGYEAAEPRTLWGLGANVGRMLSAVIWPFQSDLMGDFNALVGVAGVGALAIAWVIAGAPRNVLFAGCALVLAVLPMAMIAVRPADGTRVVLLSLVFLCAAAAGLASLGVAHHRWRWLVLGITLALLALLPGHVKVFLREMAMAAGPSRQAKDTLLAIAGRDFAENTVLVLREPNRVAPLRILDPGAAPMMMLTAHWLELPGTSVADVHDMQVPKFGLMLKSRGRSIVISHELQPWMERAVTVQPGWPRTEATLLRRAVVLPAMPPEEGSNGARQWLVSATETTFAADYVSIEVLARGILRGAAHCEIDTANKMTIALSAPYFAQAGQSVTWTAVELPQGFWSEARVQPSLSSPAGSIAHVKLVTWDSIPDTEAGGAP